jgi:hypothetical protein
MKEIGLTSGVCNVAYGCELSPMNKKAFVFIIQVMFMTM